jgi:hypothetical protein
MTRPKKNLADLTRKEKATVLDESIASSVVSFMLHMPEYRIVQIRYQNKYRDRVNTNAKNYRKRIREKEMQVFGKPYGTHKGWSKEEERILLEYVKNGHTHQEIAQKLNRSTYSVSKKYLRLIKEQEQCQMNQ